MHIQTDPQAVEDLISVIRQLAEEKKAAGFVPPEKKSFSNGIRPYSSIYVRGVKRSQKE